MAKIKLVEHTTLKEDAAFLALHEQTFADASEERAHLTPDQTAEYVDKDLSGDALQIARDHLATCERCALAVDDLRAFRNEIAPSLEREYAPATTAPSRSRFSAWWQRTVASGFRVVPIPALAAALGVLLISVTYFVMMRSQRRSMPQEQVAAAPSPSPVPVEVTTPSLAVSPQSEPAPAVVAQLNDGAGVLSLDQDGKLSGADDLPPAYQNLIKKALTTHRLEKSPQLQGLTRPPSSLMSGDNQRGDFSVIEPAGNVLLTNQPRFRWSKMEGASSYIVEVYNDQFKLIASSPQLTSQTWTADQPLTRGKVYSWQVKATKAEQEITSPRPPAPQAKFRILDQAKAKELANAKRTYPTRI